MTCEPDVMVFLITSPDVPAKKILLLNMAKYKAFKRSKNREDMIVTQKYL